MKARYLVITAALLGSVALSACGGGTSSSSSFTPPSGGGNTQSSQAQTEDAIASADAAGGPVKSFGDMNDATGSPLQSSARLVLDAAAPNASGTCNNGVEFFAPDRNGDPNSTEYLYFYDNACTGLARDVVRIWTSTGPNSETVARTTKMYALNSSTAYAVATENNTFTHASFDAYGYPLVRNGFDRTDSSELEVVGVKIIEDKGEFVVQPASGNTLTFCSDEAGYNETGYSSLNETFGWSGLVPAGSRTLNSDGSVTWQTTRTGNAYTGAIGSLSIHTGVQNTVCPISAPMFTISGGTLKGSFSLPVSATFLRGVLVNLTITNATLLNGDTLNVTTNNGLPPSDQHFISGTLAKNGVTIATFNVNAFGDGILTITATGKQYVINDWHVVR